MMWTPLAPNNESLSVATWRPEPLGRGTWSILWTCLITLSLCIWSALHLNIPKQGKAGKQWWQKARWLVVGLAVPEIIAFVALAQRTEQGNLSRDMVDALGAESGFERGGNEKGLWARLCTWMGLKAQPLEDEEINLESREPVGATPRERHHPWTTTHGFFALMGGFALDTSKRPDLVRLPYGRTRLTLSVKGVKILAKLRPDLIPDVSAEQIRDKSKAGYLAKTLICLQTFYFCFQFISRLYLGFAVTLLEINTFAHAFYAFAIYLLWWDKPLDVDEPILIPIEDDEAASICSAMFLASMVGQVFPVGFNKEAFRMPALVRFLFRYGRIGTAPLGYPLSHTHREDDPELIPADPQPMMISASADMPLSGFRFSKGILKMRVVVEKLIILMVKSANLDVSVNIPADMLILRRAASSTGHGRDILTRSSEIDDGFDKNDVRDWVTERTGDWPHDTGGKRRVVSQLQFIGLSVLYGGWHLIAWNGPFHTRTQEILWRVSGLGVAASALFYVCFLLFIALLSPLGYLLTRFLLLFKCLVLTEAEDGQQTVRTNVLEFFAWILSSVVGVVGLCLLLCVLFSRTYIVVGCFLSLPYLPASAFKTPEWSLYFPHIS